MLAMEGDPPRRQRGTFQPWLDQTGYVLQKKAPACCLSLCESPKPRPSAGWGIAQHKINQAINRSSDVFSDAFICSHCIT